MLFLSEDLRLIGQVTDSNTVKVSSLVATSVPFQVCTQSGSAWIEMKASSAVSCSCFVDSTKLLIGTSKATIECWDVESATKLDSIKLPSAEDPAIDIIFGPRGAAVITRTSPIVTFINVSTEEGKLSFGESIKADTNPLTVFAYRHDKLVTASKKRLRVWDLSSKSLLETIPVASAITGLLFSDDASRLLVNTASDVSIAQGASLKQLYALSGLVSSTFTSAGDVAVLTTDKRVHVIKTTGSASVVLTGVEAVRNHHAVLAGASGTFRLTPITACVSSPVEASEALLAKAATEPEFVFVRSRDLKVGLEAVNEMVSESRLGKFSIRSKQKVINFRRAVTDHHSEILKNSSLMSEMSELVSLNKYKTAMRASIFSELCGKLDLVLGDREVTAEPVEDEVIDTAKVAVGDASMSTDEHSSDPEYQSEDSD